MLDKIRAHLRPGTDLAWAQLTAAVPAAGRDGPGGPDAAAHVPGALP